MKNIFVGFAFLLSLTSVASEVPGGEAPPVVSSEAPLLSKTQGGGFIPLPLVKHEICVVYPNRIEIKKSSGSLTTTKIVHIEISGDLHNQIAMAATGKVVQSPAPTDGPITEYLAFHIIDGQVALIKLKAEGSLRLKNDSQAVLTLVNFLDQNCE